MRTTVSVVVALVVWGLAATAQARLVACVGDSITYGSGIANRTRRQLSRPVAADPAAVRSLVGGPELRRQRGDAPEPGGFALRASRPRTPTPRRATRTS